MPMLPKSSPHITSQTAEEQNLVRQEKHDAPLRLRASLM